MKEPEAELGAAFGDLTREGILKQQELNFRRLLLYVWYRSAFYRDYYSAHGIKEHDLSDIAVGALPIVTKALLMENFDGAVTDTRLTKRALELWLREQRDPGTDFLGEFIVVHGSGSSGSIGIFVYQRTAWRFVHSAMAGRLPTPENYPAGKTKTAFYLATHGHFGAVSTAARMPNALYDTLIISVLDSSESVIKRLNDFQPHRLQGYPSSISELADRAIAGRLQIRPKRIFLGGEALTKAMEQKIHNAWGAPVHVLYSASESKCIGIQYPGAETMAIMDDLNILEMLDARDRPVRPGEEGRAVVTNLYNYALPVLRYELNDWVVLGDADDGSPFSLVRQIKGRVNDGLPVILDTGKHDVISPHVLSYLPDIEKIQYSSLRPDHFRIDYVASRDLDAAVRSELQRILALKGAGRTTFEVRRVETIANDPQTGKLRLVKVEHGGLVHRSDSANVPRRRPRQARALYPKNVFTRFLEKDVEQSVPERFEKQVVNFGTRVAVKDKTAVLTYNDLNQIANRVAQAILARRGRKPETIAVLLGHDAQTIAAILGILKAGKICVPLDPSYPKQRMLDILEDSEAALILSGNKHGSSSVDVPSGKIDILNVQEIDLQLAGGNAAVPPSPGDPAYIVYTSGSTGRPKGVLQSHRTILHNALRYTNSLHISAEDRVTLLASLGTGQGVPTMFCTLLNGARLCLFNVRDEGIARLGDWLREEEITVYISAATVFRHFAQTLVGREEFPRLRLVRLGAEQVRKSDFELYRRHFPGRCLFGATLSATETGNYSHYFLDKQTEVTEDIIPAGYVAEGVSVLLLGEEGKPVAFNEIGEIAIKSRYVSPGYWKNEEQNQAAFIPDPEGGSERVFRTGDLGLFRPDGCLLHRGRKGFAVKIRGFRVELEEIEIMLRKHPAVSEAVVDLQGSGSAEERLIAFILPRAGDEAAPAAELRRFLRDRLPAHMVPSAFALLERLPLTPVGKVDRKALAGLAVPVPERQTAFAPPRDATEEKLARIFTEVLGVNRVGIHDDFFDLGGHSLAAARAVARIMHHFKLELPVQALFQSPTIAAMADVITRSETGRNNFNLGLMLAELESLSDHQVQQIIAQEERGAAKK